MRHFKTKDLKKSLFFINKFQYLKKYYMPSYCLILWGGKQSAWQTELRANIILLDANNSPLL